MEKGEEIILGGDFNTGAKRVTAFHTWLTDLSLVDTRAGEVEGTFVHGEGESTLDHIIVSTRLAECGRAVAAGRWEVRKMRERGWGHRAIINTEAKGVTEWLRLGAAEQNWRGLRRKAGQEAFKRRPPPRVDAERFDAFQAEVKKRLDWEMISSNLAALRARIMGRGSLAIPSR